MAAYTRSSGTSVRCSSESFWPIHSRPRWRRSTSNPGGASPEANSSARSRRCQLPCRKARAPASNNCPGSVTPCFLTPATAWLAASSCASWCSCQSAMNSSLFPPKWW